MRSPEEHGHIWEEVFSRYEGLVNYCAFQDGTVYEGQLSTFLQWCAQGAAAHGIELWTNVETFDRDMPIDFLPLEWRKLVNKLAVAEPYVRKAITFEFPHFMSPNSMWPSARSLFDRYMEYVEGGHHRTGDARGG